MFKWLKSDVVAEFAVYVCCVFAVAIASLPDFHWFSLLVIGHILGLATASVINKRHAQQVPPVVWESRIVNAKIVPPQGGSGTAPPQYGNGNYYVRDNP